jgi:mannose-6-phosphate isomerase-like protein (cupin superfamily)
MSIQGHVSNIEKLTLENNYFRQVLYTSKHTQLVLMSLKPGEEIGEEVHELDQFIRCEAGQGKVVLNGVEYEIGDGSAVVVPQGMLHNVVNTSKDASLKLYSLYSPPEHRDGVVHATKEDADADNEHFDGVVSEQEGSDL